MKTDTIQVKADEDGCVYIYNVYSDTWSKLCDVKKPELPESVKLKIQKAQCSSAGKPGLDH